MADRYNSFNVGNIPKQLETFFFAFSQTGSSNHAFFITKRALVFNKKMPHA